MDFKVPEQGNILKILYWDVLPSSNRNIILNNITPCKYELQVNVHSLRRM